MANNAVKYAESFYESIITEVDERKKHQNLSSKPSGAFMISSIDLNISENSLAHHTNDYEQSQTSPFRLIIRRGQNFVIKLHVDRDFSANTDALMVEMDFGSNPSVEKMTRKLLEVVRNDEEANIAAPVGEWVLKIYAGSRYKDVIKNFYLAYTNPDYIFVLFNAWCKDDLIYMENEEEKQEYILNDHGSLWRGAKRSQYASLPWNFGQFEDVCLYAALVTLRDGKYLTDEERADPVLVARRLTAAVNDNILEGRWSEPFFDGKAPWSWSGSVDILDAYLNSPQTRVKYGQCWVFAGVLNTSVPILVFRTLGIPSRPVTNIRSAHDTDRTLTIDKVFIKNTVSGEYEKENGPDSVWNFHVWNEIWCTRPDLPDGFDGWQACDSTPQEESQGRYQCGPMSVEAIRRGEVALNYDGWFIYGEVNADVVQWYYIQDYDAPLGKRLISTYVDKNDVGRCVITSSIGDSMKAMTLTSNYKAVEGSSEERMQIRHAVRQAVQKNRDEILKLYQQDEGETLGAEDVQFKLHDLDSVKFGQNIHSQLMIKNTSKVSRKINWNVKVFVLRYTGAKHALVTEAADSVILKSNREKTVAITADLFDYGDKVAEHTEMCVDVSAVVEDTEQIFSKRDVFLIEKPEIFMQAESVVAYLNRPITVSIHIINPINEKLHDCHLTLEGCGLVRSLPINCPQKIAGRGEVIVKHSVLPRRLGNRTLLAVFNSRELANIRGICNIKVIKD